MGRKTFRKIITSDELDKQIDVKSWKLVERFLKTKGRTVSKTTVTGYLSDMRIFLTWNLLENDNKHFVEIERIEFSDFFVYTTDELRWGSSRNNRMRSTLSSFSQFISKYFYKDFPDFRNVILEVIETVPKEIRREKTVLSDDDTEKILKHFEKSNKQLACWFALAIFSGMRSAELLRVNVETIEEAEDAFDGIFLYTSPILSKGRGGNRKDSKYILKKEFLPYFNKWKKEREKLPNVSENKSLFVKKNGDSATSSTVRIWTKEISDVIGKPFYVHSARHRMTTSLSLKRIPRPLIQAILGWKSAELVEIYDDSTVHDKNYPELDVLR